MWGTLRVSQEWMDVQQPLRTGQGSRRAIRLDPAGWPLLVGALASAHGWAPAPPLGRKRHQANSPSLLSDMLSCLIQSCHNIT